MNIYKSVYYDKPQDSYHYVIVTRFGRLEDDSFKTAEEAAWECDKARFAIGHLLRRKRGYNFPERIASMSESEMQNVSRAVLNFLKEHDDTVVDLGPSGLTDEMRARVRPVSLNIAEASRLSDIASKKDREEALTILSGLLAEAQEIRSRVGAIKTIRVKPIANACRDLVASVIMAIEDLNQS
jgi:hypothetical protein